MNEGLIPRRYAKALLEFASERSESERIYRLMHNLATSFVNEDRLQTAVSNPFVESVDKINLLTTAASAQQKDKSFYEFMSLLATNKRLDMSRDIALAYLDIYRKANNIYLVEVVTATKLSENDESRLKSLIQTHLNGATMEYTQRVNEDLIGGFIINIGSERLDASISNELKQLRLKLISN